MRLIGEGMMDNNREILMNLIQVDNLEKMSAAEIIDEIASNLYKKENFHIKNENMMYQIPLVIKDTILLIDFDIEVNMNSILGFLENSTGLFLNETIDALERIGAFEDMKVLINIREIMEKYKVTTHDLRNNVNKESLYEISSFIETHGDEYDEMADEISMEADKLYIGDPNRNIFDNLEIYIEKHKNALVGEILN
jgi:hypothetical protein